MSTPKKQRILIRKIETKIVEVTTLDLPKVPGDHFGIFCVSPEMGEAVALRGGGIIRSRETAISTEVLPSGDPEEKEKAKD